jgi:hypothetical protein
MTHTCHAVGCSIETMPELLMCAAHWRLVPVRLRQRVYATYRPGQCDDKEPSWAWHAAADWAIASVAQQEGRLEAAEMLRTAARRWEARASGDVR